MTARGRRSSPTRDPLDTLDAWIRRLALAGLSGGLSALLGARYSLWAWVSLIPLLTAIRGATVPQGFGAGIVTGAICTAVCASGLRDYGALLYGAVVVGLGVSVGLATSVTTWLGRGQERSLSWALIPPTVWTAFAQLPTWLDWPIPSSVASSQADLPVVLQIASLTGPAGVAYLLILGNAIAAHTLDLAWERRRKPQPTRGTGWWTLTFLTLVTLGGPLAFGTARLAAAKPTTAGVKVAVVQGGLPIEYYRAGDPANRQLLRDRYLHLTNVAGQSQPTLIVWPEEPTLGDLVSHDRLDPAISELATRHGAALIIGSSTGEPSAAPTNGLPEGRRFNSALLVESDGTLAGRYDKRRLSPFEPYHPGGRSPLMETASGRLGILICEESLFPSLTHELIQRGAEVIVELSNDAGFGQTPTALFHARQAVLTAVSYHRPYVRAGQSGPSYLIDAAGRVTALAGMFEATVLVNLVEPSRAPTPYRRWGLWFPLLCLAAGLVAVLSKVGALHFRMRRPLGSLFSW